MNIEDFKDFIAEFGYNTNDKEQLAEAKRVFNNCQSIYAKANSIFSSYDLEIIRATCSQY